MGFFPPSRRLVAGHFLDAKVQDNWRVVKVGSNIPLQSSSDFLRILREEKMFHVLWWVVIQASGFCDPNL